MAALYFIGKLERYYRIRTDDPLGEIWKCFLKFADVQYLQRHWQGHCANDLTRVSTYVRQANEYHLASRNSSLLTRPVLSYYSFLNLAKAVLFLLTDNTPSDYHGLCRHQMNDCLLEVSAETNNGVFLDLADTLGGQIANRVCYTIEDFVLNTVELRDRYQDYFQREPVIIEPRIEVYLDGNIYITITPSSFLGRDRIGFIQLLSDRTSIFADFEEESGTSDQPEVRLKIRVPIPKGEINSIGSDLLAKHFMFSVFDSSSYYLNLSEQVKRVPPVAAYFGIMFLLSCIARYGPNHIDQFVNWKDTSVGWFFRELCELAERVFPNILLNAMQKANLKFAPSFSL